MQETQRPVLPAALAAAGFLLLFHAVWWAAGGQSATQGFVDGDSYTHLIRVQRLVETGAWLDNTIPSANAPYGTDVHWTRLFDLVLLATALPLVPLLGFAKALYWAGMMISPLLHLATGAALAWALAPWLGRAGGLLAAALTVTQTGLFAFALMGRADHHMLFVLLAVLALGFLIRLLAPDGGGPWTAPAVGLSLAAGVWVGPEMLLFTALVLAIAGLPWLFGAPGAARRNLGLTLGLTIGLVVATLIERGPGGFMTVEYDRVSVLSITIALLPTVFWFAVCRLEDRGHAPDGPVARALLAMAGAGLAGAVLVGLYPKILTNPLLDVDPAVLPIYRFILEYAAVRGESQFLFYAAGGMIALPWALWRLGRAWTDRVLHPAERWRWAALALMLAVYLALGIAWIRWTLYLGLVAAVVLADLIIAIDHAVDARLTGPARLPIKLLAIGAVAAGPFLAGSAALYAGRAPAADQGATPTAACPVRRLAEFLDGPAWADRPRTIVASANFGPEIAYRTRHRVVATVHHRNARGLLDGWRILNATDMAVAHRLIAARHVDLVALCPGSGDDRYFLMGDAPESLYRRLERGAPPAWLERVPLPDQAEGGLAERFLLFRVRPEPTR